MEERERETEDRKMKLSIKSDIITDNKGKALKDEEGEPLLVGIPYGIIPRLLLYYVCTEAKKTGSPEVHLGETFLEIYENALYRTKNSDGIRGNEISRLKEQYEKLFSARISMEKQEKSNLKKSIEYVHIVDFFEKDIDSAKKIGRVRLNKTFFEYLMGSSRHSV